MPQHHHTAPRGSEVAPRSVFLEGRFGRLFRNLPAFELELDEASLARLDDVAATMLEPPDPGTSGEAEGDEELDGPIPAGFTYLGQFIDHDITFDPASSLQRLQDPEGLKDFRTPRFDLDSVYGDGPNNDPYLYDADVDDGKTKFLIGKNGNGEDDLPRNVLAPDAQSIARGRALIGDPRNDENVIVGQLHLLLLKFHNKVVDTIRAQFPELSPDGLFIEAQRVARWHYQWIVVHDFLKRIVGEEVIRDIIVDRKYIAGGGGEITVPQIRLVFYHWQQDPFMPIEFSVAAYRFGHSMIRPDYRLNSVTPEIPIFTSGDLHEEHQDLRGFRPLASQWTIDWSFFVEVGDGSNLQRARRIDAKLAAPLADVPGTGAPTHALAARNLRRGNALKLPAGQRVARAMGIEPLGDADLGLTGIAPVFADSAPLWFYVLKEAELAGGARLGPVGGRIVAEVLLGLLKGDAFSYINAEPNWKPDLPASTEGDFTLADLVTFTLGSPGAPDPSQPWAQQ
jgi:hypothetical protein